MADPAVVKMLEGIDKSDARLLSIVDDVLKRLVEIGQARYMRIPPKLVGVHPANRSGFGVSAIEVHALGSEIVRRGWLPDATTSAVCMQDDDSKTIAKHSYRLSTTTPGLGVVDQSEIAYGSLACTHTNQFLVAVECEVESEYESLTIEGRMSRNKFPNDRRLLDALDHGLTWLVLKAEVGAAYPQLADIVQWARNATGATQRKESEVEVLVKIQASMVVFVGLAKKNRMYFPEPSRRWSQKI